MMKWEEKKKHTYTQNTIGIWSTECQESAWEISPGAKLRVNPMVWNPITKFITVVH